MVVLLALLQGLRRQQMRQAALSLLLLVAAVPLLVLKAVPFTCSAVWVPVPLEARLHSHLVRVRQRQVVHSQSQLPTLVLLE
jgi:hypothetical protein